MALAPDLAQWRKEQRARLLAQRLAITPEQRHHWNKAITAHLLAGFPMLGDQIVSFYWPFKQEFDPRFALRQWRLRGTRAALPVVLGPARPLQFREWWPGVRCLPGVYQLPQPQDTEILVPDVCLIPPLGFDARGYRLGYGGGYFDRTLAALSPAPLKIGVAFESARMASIEPQPHDIAMDFIVTPAGIHHVGAGGLEPVDDMTQVQGLVNAILAARRPA